MMERLGLAGLNYPLNDGTDLDLGELSCLSGGSQCFCFESTWPRDYYLRELD